MEFGDLVSGIAFYLDPLLVFHIPLHLPVNEALPDVGFNIRVYAKSNIFFVLFVQYEIEIVFYIVHQQNGWPYSAAAVAGWANFAGNNVHFRPHPLSGNLNKAEFTWR